MDPDDEEIADITEWEYDEATGLLVIKRYGDDSEVGYYYTVDGKLSVRSWARLFSTAPLTTTYRYYDGTQGSGWVGALGELWKVEYGDDTPDVLFGYNRLGSQAKVLDAMGTREFTYETTGPRLTEGFTASPSSGTQLGNLLNKRLKTVYQDYVVAMIGGNPALIPFVRLSTVSFGSASFYNGDYSATYAYDDADDRMNKVTGPGLPTGGANYTYFADSHLIAKTEFKSGTTVQAASERHYEANRDLVDWVENRWGSVPNSVSKYVYENDVIGRRTSCVRTGDAFSGSGGESPSPHNDVWLYNNRNELTGTTRYKGSGAGTPGSGTADPDLDREYSYDPIGNRKSYTEGTAAPLQYCANELNQYETIDDDSSACPPNGTADEAPVYDADGNLTQSNNTGEIAPGTPPRKVNYTWNAENRLVAVEPDSPQSGDKKVTYAYDYMGRRIEKKVFVRDGSGWPSTPITHTRFIWFNWLLILELDGRDVLPTGSPDGVPDNTILRKYTWGLDLAGQSGSLNSIERAAGIGGLLSVLDTNGANPDLKYIYCYDANGNVVQLLDPAASSVSAAIVAKYEYDAYGTALSSSGTYTDNPFQFSTKYRDDETSLGYWGYRYLSSARGRWLNRDPAGEEAGINLYSNIHNAPTLGVDILGRSWIDLANAAIGAASYYLCDFPGYPEAGLLPKGDTTSSPWWHWPFADEDEDIDIGMGDFRDYILGLPAANRLRNTALGDLRRKLADHCKCGDCGDREVALGGREVFDESAMMGATGVSSWLYAFVNVNGLHLKYVADCKIRNCCNHCKASCTVMLNYFDYFHIDMQVGNGTIGISNPIVRGPLAGSGFENYYWNVISYRSHNLVIPCSE